jgi:hypothetical protein
VLFTFIVFSCQLDDGPEKEHHNETTIANASEGHKDASGAWAAQETANARVSQEFNTDNLMEISNSELSRWAVVKNGDPNTSLSFVFDAENNINRAFISTSVKNPDSSVTSKVYNLENKLMLEIVNKPDGSTQVINRGTPGTLGWWAEFEYCVDEVGGPFNSPVANRVFEGAAVVSTGGLWLPALALVCAGVATGRNYQNRDKS